MKRLRVTQKTGWLWAILVASGMSGWAGRVTIEERYAEDPLHGYHPDGQVGRCLAVFTGAGLSYVVPFSRTNVPEGTFSCWIKPMWSANYENQSPVSVSGVGGVGIYGNETMKTKRLSYPGGHVDMDRAFYKMFHHVLHTWAPDGEQTWLDGMRVYNKPSTNLPPRNVAQSRVTFYSPSGCLVDEVLVLDRRLAPPEIEALYRSKTGWNVDSNTVFYAPFDDSLTAQGYITGGDAIRMFSQIGRVDATFRAGDQAGFTFRILNTTPNARKLTLKATVHDLERQVVHEQAVRVKARAAALTDQRVDLKALKRNGLFWGTFALADEDGRELARERIPFAKTLARNPRTCTGREMRTGFTCAKGLNPPTYQKWGLIHYDDWYTLEQEEGQWYFDRLDLKVYSLLAGGTIPIIMFAEPPGWFRQRFTNNTAVLDGYYYPDSENPEAMRYWRRYVSTVAERYKGKVFDYEIYGEAYGRSSSRHYAQLVNISADALHAVDPRIRTVCNLSLGDWGKDVAKRTAGKADYYTSHPYAFAGGRLPSALQDETAFRPLLTMLKEAGAKVKFANTEYGAFQLLTWAIGPDGYPLTIPEVDAAWAANKMPESFYKRGRDSYVDWFTAGFRAVRGHVLNLALDCEYALWWSSVGGSMIADLEFAPHTPSLASMAYANVSGLLDNLEFVSRVELGGSSLLKGYLFKNSDYCLVAFTDDIAAHRIATVYVELTGSRIRVLDIEGNAVSTDIVGGIARLDFRANRPLFITGLAGAPTLSRPVLATTMVTPQVFPGQTVDIRATVYNPFKDPIEGTIQLKLPVSFAPVPGQPVAVPSHQCQTQSFMVAVPVSAAGRQEFTAELKAGGRPLKNLTYADELPVRVGVRAAWTNSPPTIDGVLEEWGLPETFAVKINRPDQVVVGIPYTKSYINDQRVDWTGENDLTAVASVCYDATNLYVAVRVRDDQVLGGNDLAGTNGMSGDGIELLVDGRAMAQQGGDTYADNVYRVAFTAPVDAFPAPTWAVIYPHQGRLVGMVCAAATAANGYAFEIKIPRARLACGGQMAPPNSMGLDIAVNDRDECAPGTGTGACRLLWGGKAEAEANPACFGRILFGEAPPAPVK